MVKTTAACLTQLSLVFTYSWKKCRIASWGSSFHTSSDKSMNGAIALLFCSSHHFQLRWLGFWTVPETWIETSGLHHLGPRPPISINAYCSLEEVYSFSHFLSRFMIKLKLGSHIYHIILGVFFHSPEMLLGKYFVALCTLITFIFADLLETLKTNNMEKINHNTIHKLTFRGLWSEVHTSFTLVSEYMCLWHVYREHLAWQFQCVKIRKCYKVFFFLHSECFLFWWYVGTSSRQPFPCSVSWRWPKAW